MTDVLRIFACTVAVCAYSSAIITATHHTSSGIYSFQGKDTQLFGNISNCVPTLLPNDVTRHHVGSFLMDYASTARQIVDQEVIADLNINARLVTEEKKQKHFVSFEGPDTSRDT